MKKDLLSRAEEIIANAVIAKRISSLDFEAMGEWLRDYAKWKKEFSEAITEFFTDFLKNEAITEFFTGPENPEDDAC